MPSNTSPGRPPRNVLSRKSVFTCSMFIASVPPIHQWNFARGHYTGGRSPATQLGSTVRVCLGYGSVCNQSAGWRSMVPMTIVIAFALGLALGVLGGLFGIGGGVIAIPVLGLAYG